MRPALLRLILCVLAAEGIAIATWLVIVQIAVNPLTPPVYVLPTLVLGAGAWLGSELALRSHTAPGSLGARRLVVWIGVIALGSAVYGELGVQVAEQPFVRPGPDLIPPGTVVSATLMLTLIAAVALAAGWLAGRVRARRRGGLSAWLGGLLAALVMVIAAVSASVGGAVTFTLTQRLLFPYRCPPHGYCLGPIALGDALKDWGFVGLILGLWLAFALWLALGLSGLVRPREHVRGLRQPFTSASGSGDGEAVAR